MHNFKFSMKPIAQKSASMESIEMQKDEQIAVVEQPKKVRKPVSELRKLTSKLDAKVRNREKNLAKIEQLKKSVDDDQRAIDSLLVEINALQKKP